MIIMKWIGKLVVIAIIAFTILFAGTFIQVFLEEVNRGIVKVLRA